MASFPKGINAHANFGRIQSSPQEQSVYFPNPAPAGTVAKGVSNSNPTDTQVSFAQARQHPKQHHVAEQEPMAIEDWLEINQLPQELCAILQEDNIVRMQDLSNLGIKDIQTYVEELEKRMRSKFNPSIKRHVIQRMIECSPRAQQDTSRSNHQTSEPQPSNANNYEHHKQHNALSPHHVQTTANKQSSQRQVQQPRTKPPILRNQANAHHFMQQGQVSQLQQHPQDVAPTFNRKLSSPEDDQIRATIHSYLKQYDTSLKWLQFKLSTAGSEKEQFEREIQETFKSLSDQLQAQQQSFHAEFKSRFEEYRKALFASLQSQKDLHDKIKGARQIYEHETNQHLSGYDRSKQDGLNAMVSQKLAKYNPSQGINNPDDLFQTLQLKLKDLHDKFTRHIEDVITVNGKNMAETHEQDDDFCPDLDIEDAKEANVPAPARPTWIVTYCNICEYPITKIDVEEQNACSNGHGKQHYNCDLSKKRLYVDRYVSAQSQYTLESTGSCTVNALEAAIQFGLGRAPSVELIDEVLALAALYKQDKHTGVADVYPAVSRYTTNLDQVSWLQITVRNIKDIMRAADAVFAQNQHGKNCVSVVLTKPPETIFMHVIKNGDIYVYDSHPRPGLDGSHILVFVERKRAEKYLKRLWPYQDLGVGFDDLHSQQINMMDVTMYQLKAGATPSKKPDTDQMSKELAKVGVKLEDTYNQSYGNKKLEQELQDAKREIASLKKQLQETQSLNDQLLSTQQTKARSKTVDDYKRKADSFANPSKAAVKTKVARSNSDDAKETEKPQTAQTFTCKSCKQQMKIDQVFIFSKCQCANMCRKCAARYLEQQLENVSDNIKKWPIKCGVCRKADCDAIDFEICGLSEEYRTQDRLIANQWTEIACPGCRQVNALKDWNFSAKSIKCSNKSWGRGCKWSGCKKCYVSWNLHDKLTCEQTKKIINDPKHFAKCSCNAFVRNITDGNDLNKYDKIQLCNGCRRKKICFQCAVSFNPSQHHSCKKQTKDKSLWTTLWEFLDPYAYENLPGIEDLRTYRMQ